MMRKHIYRTGWKQPATQDIYVCQLLALFKATRIDTVRDSFGYYMNLTSTPDEDSPEVRRLKIKFGTHEFNEMLSGPISRCCLGKGVQRPVRRDDGGWVVSPHQAYMENLYWETIAIDYDDFNGYLIPVYDVEVYSQENAGWIKLSAT